MILTAEEREKFAQWLEQDVESARLLVEQLKKLPGGDPVVEKLQTEMLAEIIVATKLRSTEDG